MVATLTGKIVQARKLYGNDSAYVIGLCTGAEWLLEAAGNSGAKQLLQDSIIAQEGGKGGQATSNTRTQTEPAGGAAAAGQLPENTWVKGLVKWFNNNKGYGFISTDGNVDVFVHWRDISSWDRNLSQDEEVEFMVTRTAKGFQAVNVMKVGAPEQGAEEREDVWNGEGDQQAELDDGSQDTLAAGGETMAATTQGDAELDSWRAEGEDETDQTDAQPR
ncbi:MAG: hypothetical protein GKR89_27710 [Candidatus Latescibacteria bacterium]|nr:hypothetical protein [Candidatus Latescibacterota bacterium]